MCGFAASAFSFFVCSLPASRCLEAVVGRDIELVIGALIRPCVRLTPDDSQIKRN